MVAVKKTELYSSLWASCDALRGGMDASQYKDYILTLLFVKYVTDKYKGVPYAPIIVPEGGSFDDMVGILSDSTKKKNIGEEMDKIVAKLAEANSDSFNLSGIIDNAHFNDEQKIGKGEEMIDKLVELINIFRAEALDFKNNKTEGDDIIGDAYEYLMRKFATESGKSKGQFYTPAEVSRVLAKVVGISNETNRGATIYDCACGSGSLLIRAVSEAKVPLSAYGQEKEGVTAGLAVMNTVLHNQPTTVIKAGNTFSDPQFFEDSDKEQLKKFDYIVANPPFSLKNWRDGLKEYGRFDGYDEVPKKKGDYAWLLHIIKSLKPNGKAAVILPHGVLYRGGTEAAIRKKIVDQGYIKGIIGLPGNLFYGTGIPACIIVIDKESAGLRDNIFMIDASKDFVKDGNKNRLREQDIYKIVNTFNNEIVDDLKYAKKVPLSEVKNEKNNYCLVIARYIDSGYRDEPQDLAGHILGGIPSYEINELGKYWKEFPSLKGKLFSEIRPYYYKLKVQKNEVAKIIRSDNDFKQYLSQSNDTFKEWKEENSSVLFNLNSTVNTKDLVVLLYKGLLEKYKKYDLVDKYSVYEVLLEYWNGVMGDDAYLVSKEGFGVGKQIEKKYKKLSEEDKTKNKEPKLQSWEGVVIPKTLIGSNFYKDELETINSLSSKESVCVSAVSEMLSNIDEDSPLYEYVDRKEGEDEVNVDSDKINERILEIRNSIVNDELQAIENCLRLENYHVTKKQLKSFIDSNPLLINCVTDGKLNKKTLTNRMKELRLTLPVPDDDKEEFDILNKYINLENQIKELEKRQKELVKDLDKKLEEKYPNLSIDQIKELIVNEKWFAAIEEGIDNLYSSLSNKLANRICVLHDKYQETLSGVSNAISLAEKELSELVSELVVNKECCSEEENVINNNKSNALHELLNLLSKDKGGDDNEK